MSTTGATAKVPAFSTKLVLGALRSDDHSRCFSCIFQYWRTSILIFDVGSRNQPRVYGSILSTSVAAMERENQSKAEALAMWIAQSPEIAEARQNIKVDLAKTCGRAVSLNFGWSPPMALLSGCAAQRP